MTVRLQVNIDHVATLRNARGTAYPDPVAAALVCEAVGCHGITAHLREDRRHIRDQDVRDLRAQVKTLLNLEMAATEEMVAFAEEVAPDLVTLVPERREERTTEGGLAVADNEALMRRIVERLHKKNIRVSMFIAASPRDIAASHAVGAELIELHTGEYAHATDGDARAHELAGLARGADAATKLGLQIAAGHGLTRANLPALLLGVPQIEEVNIGHALVADALWLGLDGATKVYREICQNPERFRATY